MHNLAQVWKGHESSHSKGLAIVGLVISILCLAVLIGIDVKAQNSQCLCIYTSDPKTIEG